MDTYGIRPESCTFGIHRGAEERRSSAVPVSVSARPGPFCVSGQRQTYKLDGHLLVVQQVRALEDHTKRALPDFLPHPVVDAHHVRR